jgi:hypothetical protein
MATMMINVVGPGIALLVVHQRGVEAGGLKATIATPIVIIFFDVSSGRFGRKVIGRRGGIARSSTGGSKEGGGSRGTV